MSDASRIRISPDNCDDATAAFAAALDDLERKGGGTLVVPPGEYRTGPIRLRSRTTLHLEAGARIRFLDDASRFPLVRTRWAGFVCHAYHPCVWADGCEDVSITGRGILDGCGDPWWAGYWALHNEGTRPPRTDSERRIVESNRDVDTTGNEWAEWSAGFLRPPLVQFHRCRRVAIEGVTLQNSPFWTCHIVFCDDVRIHAMRVRGPVDMAAPNTDGLDIDSSSNVVVSDCHFHAGDDAIVLKSGIGRDGIAAAAPTENVTITNCLVTRGHAGIVFGSETAGWIRRVAISNCIFQNVYWGIRLKSRRGRGGGIEDVRASNLVMDRLRCPVTMNLYYTAGTTAESRTYEADPGYQPTGPLTPAIRNVRISGVTATNVTAAAGVMIGLPESPIRDVSVTDLFMTADRTAREPQIPAMSFKSKPVLREGLHIEDVERLALRHLDFEYENGEPVRRINVREEIEEGVQGRRIMPAPDEVEGKP